MDLLLLPTIGKEDSESKVKLNPSVFGPPIDIAVNLLDELVKIKIGDEGKSVNPFSTPSVYRRALDLYSAISNPEEWLGRSEVFVTQWRRMVALLALSAKYNMNIKFQKVSLDNPPAKSIFLRTCSSNLVLPTNTDAFDGMDWPASCYNIIFDYKPPAIEDNDGQLVLGATSPSTLFFPADDFDKAIAEIEEKKKKDFSIEKLDTQDIACVYDWVLWFSIENREELKETTVLDKLVGDFMSDLLVRVTGMPLDVAQKLPPHERYPGWDVKDNWPIMPSVGVEGRFKQDAFTPDKTQDSASDDDISDASSVGGGAERFNFSVKQRVKQGEWRALFTGLALNKLKDYGIVKEENKLVAVRDGKERCIATYNKYKKEEWVDPEAGIAKAIGLDVISSGLPGMDENESSPSDFLLTHFEWLCVYQYLARLENSDFARHSTITLQHINTFKADIVSTKLAPYKSKTGRNVWQDDDSGNSHVLIWEDNRFTGSKLNTNGLDAFDFSVHKHNAPFFEDLPHEDVPSAGYYHNIVVRQWFNVLTFIAFKDIRRIHVGNVDINSTMEIPDELVTESGFSPLYHNTSKNYKLQGICINNDMIAVSSADTLLAAIPGGETAMQAAFYKLLTRERYPRYVLGTQSMYDRTGTRGSKNAPAPNFVVDSALYDFEIALFAKWLDSLVKGLSNRNGVDVKIEPGRDKSLLIALVERKKIELLKHIGVGSNEDISFAPYFDASEACFTDESESTLKYFSGAIADNLFLDRLVRYRGTDQLECKILNYETDRGAPTILGGMYTCKNNNLEPVTAGGIILPFTEVACKYMHQFSAAPDESTSRWYGLDFVEVYRGLYDDTNVYEISVLSHVANGKTFPMIKQYAVNGNIDTANAIDDVLPAVAIWPDVEIEHWKSYAVSIINTSASNNYNNISFPSFISANNSGPNNLEIGSLSVADFRDATLETEITVTPLFKTFTVEKYPRMLDVHFDGRPSGCLFVRPRWIKADGTEGSYFKAGNESVRMGVDFGTTNSVAYIMGLNGKPVPFDLSLVESNYVTTKIREGFDLELPAAIASQRKWVVDSGLGDTRERSVFSSTLMRFNGNNNPLPFIHANIYRTSGLEIGNFAQHSMLGQSRYFKYDMKWTGDIDALNAFLGQFALMCCVAAVKIRNGNVGVADFRVSYPTSLPEAQRQKFNTAWNGEALKQVRNFSGFTNASVQFFNESISTGLACIKNDGDFFLKTSAKDPFTHGFVCMDIGGGSMDISVVQRKTVVDGDVGVNAHLSIPFAAQYILTAGIIDQTNRDAQAVVMKFYEHLNKRMDSLTNGMTDANGQLTKHVELLQMANAGFSKGLAGGQSPEPKKFIHAIDTYVKNCAGIVEKLQPFGRANSLSYEVSRVQDYDVADGNSIKHLSKIKMSIAGLMYFIGGLIKKLRSEERFRLADGDNLNVFLAGNGSKMIDWVHYDGDNLPQGTKKDSHGILPLYVKEGLGDTNCTINLLPSDRPKSEAAYGLVYAEADRDVEPFVEHDIDRIIYEHKDDKDNDEFMRRIGEIYATRNIQESEYKDLGTKDNIVHHLTMKLNEDYQDDKLIDEIANFILAFYKISPVDFNRIFKEKATDIEKARNIAKYYIEDIKVHNANSQLPPISVRAYNGYAVLKFIMLILVGL